MSDQRSAEPRNELPAFPVRDCSAYHWHGLTKRELFAAMAMQGVISNPESSGSFETFAKEAVRYADALLKEMEKP